MKKKWIVIPSLLVLTVIGVMAMPILQHMWNQSKPKPVVVVDGAMRSKTIDTLVAKLNAHYIFPEKAKQIEVALRQRQQEGKYEKITDGEQLARQLTADMQAAAPDKHMMVWFAPGLVLPDDDGAGPPAETQAEWEQRTNILMRLIMRQVAKRDVQAVERLNGNIGYVRLSGFGPDFLVAEKFGEVMDELANTNGLIVDLRHNGGGSADTVALLVSYFVDQRTHLSNMWDRTTGMTKQYWTQDKLHGKRYGSKKPVLILVGPGTMSAGEDFAYTMQALKRATVIGERTWGGANPSRPHRISEHFSAGIPERQAINTITKANWEGVGVIPDVAAKTDKAFDVATDLLQRRLKGDAAVAAAGD